MRDKHDRGSGHDDPVRDDPMRQVGRGDCDEDDAEEGGDRCTPREPEAPHAPGDEQRGSQLNGGVERADAHAARTAAPAQHRV